MNTKKYLLTFAVAVSSIVSTYFVTISTAQQGTQTVPATADNEYQVAAVLYQQHAAEYRALAFQAFNLAKFRLDEDFDKKHLKKLSKEEREKSRAVVVDIDETVLDNSPSQAYQIKNRLPFNMTDWIDWGEKRSAKAIPGAGEFLKYANQKGVRVFYVSNRAESQKQATIDNLKAVGFPDVSNETLLLQTAESNKEARRKIVLEKHRIVLLVGDNLNDFAENFEKKSVADRFAETEKDKNLFGSKYIVLPNAMYGAWENSIYDNKRLTEAEKTQKRKELLESYK
jgi:5'-nucleotidase (lipoprotein e(P4) family)